MELAIVAGEINGVASAFLSTDGEGRHNSYRVRSSAANVRRELPRIPFASATTSSTTDPSPNECHPERSEGPMHSAGTTHAADESIDPSARKKRGPQNDKAKNSSVTSVSSVASGAHNTVFVVWGSSNMPRPI
jgi:hypothetical protein